MVFQRLRILLSCDSTIYEGPTDGGRQHEEGTITSLKKVQAQKSHTSVCSYFIGVTSHVAMPSCRWVLGVYSLPGKVALSDTYHILEGRACVFLWTANIFAILNECKLLISYLNILPTLNFITLQAVM